MAECNINGVNIYYEDIGDKNSKNCIVFFNGAMSSTNSWGLIYPLFEGMGWRVILHDFRGQLKSDKPLGPYTFKDHADDAKALFDYLGIEKMHVAGTSYGGRVAMEFAILYPQAALSISIIDSFSESNAYIDTIVKGWETSRVFGNGESFLWNAVPIFYGKTFIANNLAEIEKRAKVLGEASAEYFDGQRAIYDTFLADIYTTDRLHQIKCPALVICGTEDILTPVSFSEIIVKNIPQAEFVPIPDCGHVAIMEKPRELESVLLGFVMKQG